MVFSIRQHATLPILKMKVFRDGRSDFKRFEELIENCVATFAMKEEVTGIYKVANKAANIVLENPCTDNGDKHYIITYQFTSSDTNKSGIYLGTKVVKTILVLPYLTLSTIGVTLTCLDMPSPLMMTVSTSE